MEWLLDVVRGFGGTHARVLNVEGRMDCVPLSEIHRRGLPAAKPEVQLRSRVSLASLRPTEPEPELRHLGFPLSKNFPNRHQAFELLVDEYVAVLPALLLMRELFAPARHFLPVVFQAQALDALSWLAPIDRGYRMVIEAGWYRTTVSRNIRDCAPVLAWLRSCRSAEAMMASIHLNALGGAVALQPPQATADIKLAGIMVGSRLLITELRLMSVTADEVPHLPLEDFAPVIKFAGRGLNGEKLGGKAVPPDEVLPHPDGSYELSDSEWVRLQPILATKAGRSSVLDQRRLLSDVVRKLGTGTPWRTMTYSCADWRNAAFAFHRLKKTGRLPEVLSLLRGARKDEIESSKAA